MGCVGTPIIGRPRRLPGRHPSRLYTVICDEPGMTRASRVGDTALTAATLSLMMARQTMSGEYSTATSRGETATMDPAIQSLRPMSGGASDNPPEAMLGAQSLRIIHSAWTNADGKRLTSPPPDPALIPTSQRTASRTLTIIDSHEPLSVEVMRFGAVTTDGTPTELRDETSCTPGSNTCDLKLVGGNIEIALPDLTDIEVIVVQAIYSAPATEEYAGPNSVTWALRFE